MRNWSFGTKLVLGVTVLVSTAIGAVGWGAYGLARESLVASRLAALEELARLEARELELALDALRSQALLARDYYNVRTHLPVLVRHVASPAHPEYQRAWKSLDSQLLAYRKLPGVTDVTLVDARGRCVYSLAAPPGKPGPPLADWERAHFERSRLGVWLEDEWPNGGRVGRLLIGAPVMGFDDAFQGVFRLHVDLLALLAAPGSAPESSLQGGVERVVGRRRANQVLAYRPDRASSAERTRYLATGTRADYPVALAAAGKSGSGRTTSCDDRDVLAAWRPVGSVGWGLVAEVDARAAFAPVRELGRRMALFGGALLLVLVAATLLLARGLVRPVKRIAETADRIRAGDLAARAPAGGGDEAGRLAEAFNRMADALLLVQARLEGTLAALDRAAIVAETDPQGRITLANDRFLEISGYSREELLGQDHRIVNSGHHPKSFFRTLWATIARGQVWKAEIKNRKKNGDYYWVDTAIAPVLDPGGRPERYIAIRFDITERKRAEERIRALNLELERQVARIAAANRELEAFSYTVSHDLRAPLRGIDGFAQAIEEDFGAELPEGARSHLARVRSASQRMGELIDDILMLSRITRQEMRHEPVDLTALAATVAAGLAALEPGRQVDFIIAPGLVAQGDRRLLRVVLENLMGNAWKFTSKRERATIEVGSAPRDRDGPAYFVRDDGVGFDMAYAGKLFGTFQRLHPASDFPGTGIGLATVQRILARHGGRVWAEGAVERGATFFFTLGESPQEGEP